MNQLESHKYDRACDAALGWIARLRSDAASEQDQQSFALWLAEDDTHKLAMDSMLEMWGDLGSLQHLPFKATDTREAANSSNWLAGAAVVAASLVLALLLWPQAAPETATVFQTAMGERHSFELQDQSRVTLNTNSRVNVTYDEETRRVHLVRGEAFFEVSKNPERPFTVAAGSANVTVLGTAFNIRRDNGGASVTVAEGVVRVSEAGNTSNRTATNEILRVNQQVYANSEGLEKVSTVDIAPFTAWQEGKLIAREMPLPELVRELQRYRDTRIIIADRDIAAMSISGVFELDQPESILRALELSLGLEVVHLGPHTLQLLNPAQ